jgi:thioredoxin reductase/NAD-dependent dihydropyrimidine dehydrogenase PreA subunit
VDALHVLALGGMLAIAVLGYWIIGRSRKKNEEAALATVEDMAALGEIVPDTFHPVIDLNRCIGSGACVLACPEHQVIGLVNGQAKLINPLACIGHGACMKACPVEAIKLVFGTATRGVELPRLDPNFQTTRPGVYVVGELGGMGLIRNAVNQGRQAADHVLKNGRRGKGDAYDAVVVGAGPAGMGATLRLLEGGIRVLLLERGAVGGAIMQYPRAKIVMTGALEFAGLPVIKRKQMSKEELVELWQKLIQSSGMTLKTGVIVEGVSEDPDAMWNLSTTQGGVRAANVLLALGRRGSPRQLGVPGEDLQKVSYMVLEPEQFKGKNVLVVGGGNSAVENAIALAEFNGCASVSISYRRDAFARCRAENRRRIDELIQAGKVFPILPSEVLHIRQDDVILSVGGKQKKLKNDAVVIQIGGTAPSELLQKFGIEVVIKRGEA